MTKTIQPWRVTASRTVFSSPWVTLRADDCINGRGVAVAPYYILEYADWVQVVAITDDAQLVCVHQYRHGSASVNLELPGGVIDAGETDPVLAARRELREETGYDGEGQLLGSHFANPGTQNNRVFSVLVTGARRVQDQQLDGSEDIAVVLKPMGEIELSGAHTMFRHIMHVASLGMALGALRASNSGSR
ncbi:MAG: NUDIX hydrolase [Beijerinckiaceae bacterium]